MDNKEKIRNTLVYKLALVSSISLFFSTALSQRLWSSLWIMYGLMELLLIVICGGTMVLSLIIWIKKHKVYLFEFISFIISAVFIVLIIILPLNDIRIKMEFALFKNQYEHAVDLALSGNQTMTKDSVIQNFVLPFKYKYLSAGGGEVIVVSKAKSKGVFFYTFRGCPDGMSGFLKTKGNSKIEIVKDDIYSGTRVLKDLGDNWYYVCAD
jgi:hypothetical protein